MKGKEKYCLTTSPDGQPLFGGVVLADGTRITPRQLTQERMGQLLGENPEFWSQYISHTEKNLQDGKSD